MVVVLFVLISPKLNEREEESGHLFKFFAAGLALVYKQQIVAFAPPRGRMKISRSLPFYSYTFTRLKKMNFQS